MPFIINITDWLFHAINYDAHNTLFERKLMIIKQIAFNNNKKSKI